MRITMSEIEYDGDQRVLYHGVPYTGTAWEFYADGDAMTEQNFHKGIPHGVSRAFYHGGRTESERWHEYGRRNGPWRTWHENGQLGQELIYDHGKIVSRGAWAEDGTPIG
ncbi:toxin-antitoxin system YwqK family antitoxin [Streptosporangium canum]|uniref:toxin-antitoxin system YwqK family antitoxin n=1 Tax=Streptosporangium canum TaxID=324952 RepID=UPI0037878334